MLARSLPELDWVRVSLGYWVSDGDLERLAASLRAARLMIPGEFTLEAGDGSARAGRLATAHGVVETPVFMPVGTRATVKGVDPGELEQLGAQVILGNTYHLHFRPGAELIEGLGGLHRFMGWDRSLLTDSGGFQVFSLAETRRIDADGVTFRSVYDGSVARFTPELAMAVQAALGSDIAMAFDECPPAGAPRRDLERAVERTARWAERCVAAPRPDGQLRFGIAQGGVDRELRARSAGAPREPAVRRLRDRRAERGGGARGDVRRHGVHRRAPAGRAAALLHGHRRPRGHPARDRRRHRHVRLRAADAARPHRLGDDLGGASQPAQRALRPRRPPAAGGLPLPGLHAASRVPISAIS